MQKPLAERMRPTTLTELAGQEHLTGEHSVLRNAIAQQIIPSMILWGPPGTGKTTIANIIAHTLRQDFYTLSAISAGVKDVREVIEQAKSKDKAILFIDEIHRFSKSQQDALLGAVEKGIVTLIGATTENPSFEVNSALLSRCQVYVLKPLTATDLIRLLQHAIAEDTMLKDHTIELTETDALIRLSGGDARKLLNLFELVVQSQPAGPIQITDKLVLDVAQTRIAMYDKGGEDIKFIARRMVILASEDIGNANPTAIVMANACFEAVNKIGYPEGRIILSQCATYLAASPKSNASYLAIDEAMAAVRQHGDLPVPLHLRNAPTKLMKELGYKAGYQYSHDFEKNFSSQEYLPDELKGNAFYRPGKNTREEDLRKFLKDRWKEKYGY
jgi:putative ATPase